MAWSKAAEGSGGVLWGEAVHALLRLQPDLLLVSISTLLPVTSMAAGCWER